MTIDDDLAAWIAGLDDLFALVAGRFFRVEPRLRARAYVRGLLAPLAAKNGWTLAEAAGDATSAGVQRQYSGTAGRVENCQLGVFCAYASSKGRALIDRELYLPKSWIADRDRCRQAGVPDDAEFATKTDLARTMLARALDAGVPAAWVTADEAYGKDGKFRAFLEQRRIGYVVAVPCDQAIAGSAGTSRADVLAAHAPAQAWKRRSCGNGAKGPRTYDWAVASLPGGQDGAPPGWTR